jgi:Zn-dependent protease
MPDSFNLLGFLLILLGWMVSLCLHEFAHAVVAYYGGDTSVREKGYLSFNPARYTDPISSVVWPLIFLFLGGIGLPGGAVYINRAALRSRGWDCAVSLAGPLANAVLLVFLLVPFWLKLVDVENPTILWVGNAFLCRLQIMAILFNLLPAPPLDGFGAISAYIDPVARRRAYAFSHVTFLLVLIVITQTDVGVAFWQLVGEIDAAVGVPDDLATKGREMMRLF